VYVVAIAVGSSSRPAAAPQTGPWSSDYKLFNQPSFSDAASAVSALVFAYAGTPAFFSIASEMRNPREYTKALITCQSVVTVTYVTVGIVVYYYAGSYVTSPAMGSAGPVIKKASYGIALPGLFATSILLIHVMLPHFAPQQPELIYKPGPKQIHICPDPAGNGAPNLKLPHPLGDMA
jgi:amino acid permease